MILELGYEDNLVEVHAIIVSNDCRCWVTQLNIGCNGTDAFTLRLPSDHAFYRVNSPLFLKPCQTLYIIIGTVTSFTTLYFALIILSQC